MAMGAKKPVAYVARNYTGNGSGGGSRKEAVEEEANKVEEMVMSTTVHTHATKLQSP